METFQNRRVLHFKASFILPTETFIYNQIRFAEHYDVSVFCRYRKSAPFDLSEINLYNKPSLLPWKLERMIAGMLFSMGIPLPLLVKNYLSKARELNPSIIHAHFGPDGAYILPLALLLGIPLVTSFYGYDVSEFPKRFRGRTKYFYRVLQEQGNCFLAMTRSMYADLASLGFPEDRIIVHHYGIHVDEFACPSRNTMSPREKIVLLQVGSLGGKKGQIYVLKALNKVLSEEKGLDINVIFVGRGPAEPELRKYAHENNLANRVSFLGFISHGEELRKVFEQSHIFIHPSVTAPNGDKEGLPTSILEAMSAELPIIATYHAGIPEAVVDGENGILVNEHDVDALARAIAILARDINKRGEFGKKAREKVRQQYDFQNQIKELEEIYSNIISAHKGVKRKQFVK